MLEALLEVVFPRQCAACRDLLTTPETLCAPCARALEPLSAQCGVCAEPGVLGQCAHCRHEPPPFSRVYSAFVHAHTAAQLVHAFKYDDHPELAPALAHLALDVLGAQLAQFEGAVGAIPLHPARLRHRRYDQAQLLAAQIARRLNRPFVSNLLTRTRRTAQQVGLSGRERESNLAEAFAAHPRARAMPVLLVDDVMTTGATARAAAGALTKCGVPDVRILTFARAEALSPIGSYPGPT